MLRNYFEGSVRQHLMILINPSEKDWGCKLFRGGSLIADTRRTIGVKMERATTGEGCKVNHLTSICMIAEGE